MPMASAPGIRAASELPGGLALRADAPGADQGLDLAACPDDVMIPTEDADAYVWFPKHRWIYNKLHVAETCAKCHAKVAAAFDTSVHAGALRKGNADSATCTIITWGPQMNAVSTVFKSSQCLNNCSHFSLVIRPLNRSTSCCSRLRIWVRLNLPMN